jgi:hypothetical protein
MNISSESVAELKYPVVLGPGEGNLCIPGTQVVLPAED